MTNHPISLRSPAALLIVVVRATGSSFRGRCFPSGSLFREPLGTTLRMNRNWFPVNENLLVWVDFPPSIFRLFSAGYKNVRLQNL